MRRLSSFLFLLILLSLSFGQSNDKPNFSGTWRLTETKNIRAHDPTNTYSKTLVIVHHEPEIRITTRLSEGGQEKSVEETYFTDGRGETNRTLRDQIIESKTKWDGNSFAVHHFDKTSAPDPSGGVKTFKLEIVEKWQLSKDAKTFTRTTTVKGPPGMGVVNGSGTGLAYEVFAKE